MGFPNGTSLSAFKTDINDSTYSVKVWDNTGTPTEYIIDANEVNLENASFIEMFAYATHLGCNGQTDAQHNLLDSARGDDFAFHYDSTNMNLKMNFKQMVKNYMDMFYENGSLQYYLSCKKLYDSI